MLKDLRRTSLLREELSLLEDLELMESIDPKKRGSGFLNPEVPESTQWSLGSSSVGLGVAGLSELSDLAMLLTSEIEPDLFLPTDRRFAIEDDAMILLYTMSTRLWKRQ